MSAFYAEQDGNTRWHWDLGVGQTHGMADTEEAAWAAGEAQLRAEGWSLAGGTP